MKNIYDLLKKDNLRYYYNKLKIMPIGSKCPYCGQREITCLDHFLPKSEFPHYAITPINLVPICTDCNSLSAKGNYFASSEEMQLVHPYFDDFDDEVWLFCIITFTTPTTYTLSFEVRQPNNWSLLKFKRMKYHFEKLKLNELYTQNAHQEINSRMGVLKRLKSDSGTKELQDHLQKEGNGRQDINKNSWQSALYVALGNSNDFCNNIMNF